MLFTTTVSVWNTKKPGKRVGVALNNVYALNTNRISDMVAGADGTNFVYSDDPDDPRDSPGWIECDHGLAGIIVHHDAIPTHKLATLNLYPHLNFTGTIVATSIEWEDIAYAYETPRDADDGVCRIVFYRNDWKRREAIVNMTLTALIVLQTA